jgi:hypothetical protein
VLVGVGLEATDADGVGVGLAIKVADGVGLVVVVGVGEFVGVLVGLGVGDGVKKSCKLPNAMAKLPPALIPCHPEY